MNLYVLLTDSKFFLGVFSTIEKANEYREKYNKCEFYVDMCMEPVIMIIDPEWKIE